MKPIMIKYYLSLLFFSVLLIPSIVACSDDDKPELLKYNTNTLEIAINEAEALIKNSEEGMKPGFFMPGAKELLLKEIDAAKVIFKDPDSQESIAEATKKLQEAILEFKAKQLRAAIPYIKQEKGSYIKISDNIKYTTNGSFSMEADYFFMDLEPIGYSNTIFSCAQMGPVSGFIVRTFSDGHVEIVIGNNNWVDVKSEPGVVKLGEWMNFALTSTGSTHKFYVNGKEVVSLEEEHLVAPKASLVVGNGYEFDDRVVNAMVKDVRVWNTVRTQEEIANNMNEDLTGKEPGLAAYFPLTVDLGREFNDLTESYTANLVGSVELIYDGKLPEIVLDYTYLDKAIQEAEDLKDSVIEGENEGEYPQGTKEIIQSLIDNAKECRISAQWQKNVDQETDNLKKALNVVKDSNIRPTLAPENTYSAVFGGGDFYSGGDAVILDLKNSGFTTVILWTIHIQADGSMVFNDKAVIDQNGNYVGDPDWGDRLAKLLEAPTTVDRIELGIGAWGSKSWENIKKLIDEEGTGPETKLYKAIKKLTEITGASAINYDDEYTYDVESTVKFSLMLNDMGLKVGLCPYTQTNYWKSVFEQVEEEKSGTIDRVYLQCYDGGAGNHPANWNQLFSHVKVSMGLWCKNNANCNNGDSPETIQSKISNIKNDLAGGFIWLYEDIQKCSKHGKTQSYATAINEGMR